MIEINYECAKYVIGTARQIKSLYKNLKLKTDLIPLFADEPIFNPHRMYGISIDKEARFYTVVGETDVVHLLMGEVRERRNEN